MVGLAQHELHEDLIADWSIHSLLKNVARSWKTAVCVKVCDHNFLHISPLHRS